MSMNIVVHTPCMGKHTLDEINQYILKLHYAKSPNHRKKNLKVGLMYCVSHCSHCFNRLINKEKIFQNSNKLKYQK